MTGTPRFTFGVPSLLDGLEFLPVTIGLFAVAEVLTTATRSLAHDVYAAPIRGLLPSRADWWACRWTLPRASLIGFVVGVLPGRGRDAGVDHRLPRRRSACPGIRSASGRA